MDDLRPALRRASPRASIAPFLAMEVAREAGRRAAAGQTIVRFDVGQPHLGAPELALAAAERALRTRRLGYTDALGAETLRAAIARLYQSRHGLDIDPKRVVITTGASGAFVLAFLALFDTGERVALAAPGYPPYRHILTSLGMSAVSIEAPLKDKLQLTAESLAGVEDLAGVLIASPANPTGAMLDAANLAALCAAARARGLALISDEIYHGLTYGAAPETALAHDPDALVINSFSKFWAMTGWRVGWLVAPEALIKPIERLAQNLTICPPALAQAAALAALEAGEECEARRQAYQANRAFLLSALPAIGLNPAAPADGAFYCLLDVSRFAEDSAAFCARTLDEAGVALTPGVDFDENRGRRWVRLAYPLTLSQVEDGIERLARFLARAP